MAGLALADGGVTSANTVGFDTNTDGIEGYNFKTAPFSTVGGAGYSITNIKLDDGGNYLIADNALQVLDPDAYTDEMYFYTEVSTGVYVWQDENGDSADRVFADGEGFLIENLDGITVTFAGEVPSADVEFEGLEGYNWMGNPYPAEISITDITLDDGGNYLIADNALQVLDPDAYTDEMYFYTEVSTGVYVWQDENGDPADRDFAPGEGFLIENLDGITCSVAKPYTL